MTYYEKYMKYKKKYLNLRQTGGAEKIINSFNNESVNFDYIDIINDEITLKNNSFEVKFKQIKNISGGSGDTVYLVINNGVRYVYKLFKVGDKDKQEKDLNEITLHNMFYNYFKELDKKTQNNYIPCPKIFLYGRIESINSNYYIMEAIQNTTENKNTVTDLVSHYCKHKEKINVVVYNKILNIIYQIFYILYHIKQLQLKHCDLHTSNIMIENNNTGKKELRIFDKNIILESYDYVVKIIDFGEGTQDKCRLERSMSSVLANLATTCGIQSSITSKILLLKQIIYSTSGDEDLDFFINIINILAKSNIISINKNNDKVISMLFELSSNIKKLSVNKNIDEININLKEMFTLITENIDIPKSSNTEQLQPFSIRSITII